MKKILAILLTSLVLAACNRIQNPEEKINLNYWGVYEPKENMDELIREYQSAHPNITITYTRKGLKEYKQQIIARAGKETGPDIFTYHNSWFPEIVTVAAPLPSVIEKSIDMQKTFYPVVATDIKVSNSYYGIPLMYDGLGLYYNKGLFRQRGLSKPPETWNEVIDTANQLKVVGEDGELEIAGIAIGSTQNIDYWSDIFGLLMIQNAASLRNPASTMEQSETAINFFKSFTVEKKVWSESLVNSIDAFSQGKVAMIFGTSWTAFDIQSKNTALEFGIAPIPQIPGSQVGIASYWVEGVSKGSSSKKQEAAWKFLQFLSTKENQQRLYAIQGKNRLFGEAPSRVDLAQDIQSNEFLNGIISTAPNARSLYINDKTFGAGLNDELIEKYKAVLENVKNKQNSEKIEELYKKYGLK